MPYRITLSILLLLSLPFTLAAQPVGTTHLENIAPGDGLYRRLLGSVGQGSRGVPVAGGFDLDKDGINDYAMAAMLASPQSRSWAGQIFLVFGDNAIGGLVDTAMDDPRVLEIHGDQTQENAGSEIWMADLTGDGFGELIICRQNYSPDQNRIGAGALTLIPASPVLSTMAAEGEILDLRNPPESLPILNIVGARAYSRLCIWARNGDVTGDGTDDLAIGADREQMGEDEDTGAVYLVRGGPWLQTAEDIDLADFGTVAEGNIARVKPRIVGEDIHTKHYHFGATLQLADLDGNGKAELIAAAALDRSGAGLAPAGDNGNAHSSGGTAHGTLYIAWDDNFAGDWIPAPDFVVGAGTGSWSIINGGSNSVANPGPQNDAFGEEILGGLDYDSNGNIDLFVGDLTADGYESTVRGNAGLAHVIYDAEDNLKGKEIGLDSPPENFTMATFLGPIAGAIAGDTALHGDFSGDGIADLAFSSPMDGPFGVTNAGTLHIVLGKNGKWPIFSDLQPASFPSSADVQIHEIYGGSGGGGGGGGDVLCYSAASGDMNDDGVVDLIVNEMQGDGSSSVDAGNLLIINSRKLFGEPPIFKDGFEQ